MTAFTEEQLNRLVAAFEHVHACMAAHSDAIHETAERVQALGLLLAAQGLLTSE